MQTIQIRALIFRENGFWCAQVLEHDIAVQAHSEDDVISELMNILKDYIETAEEEGKVPFAGIPPAPEIFFKKVETARERTAPIKTLQSDEAPHIVPNLRVFEYALN